MDALKKVSTSSIDRLASDSVRAAMSKSKLRTCIYLFLFLVKNQFSLSSDVVVIALKHVFSIIYQLSNLGIMTVRLLPAIIECFKSEYVSVRIEAAMVSTTYHYHFNHFILMLHLLVP